MFKIAPLLSSLLVFDFPSGEVGDEKFPKLYERNLMCEYFERLIYE